MLARMIDAAKSAWRAGLLALLTLAVIGFSAAWAAVGDQPVRRALVIGMSGYDDPEMRVPGDRTKADAEGVAETLKTVAGYVAPTLMPSDADTITFMKVFTEFARTVDAGDQVLVFYSGHGVEFRGDAYLLLREAHADLARDGEDAVTKAALDRSAVKVKDLVERLQQSGAANVILVLNACRNATDAPLGQNLGTGDGESLGFDLPPPGRISGLKSRDKTGVGTLFATSGDTFAEVCLGDCAKDQSPYTVFGRHFIATLGQPNLTVRELVDEVGLAVQDDVATHFPNREQVVDWHDQTNFRLKGRIFLGPVGARAGGVEEAKLEAPVTVPFTNGADDAARAATMGEPDASLWDAPDVAACAELAAPPWWNPRFKGFNNLGEGDKAVAACEAAMKRHPNSVELAFLLGVAKMIAGQYDVAIQQFQAGVDKGYPVAETFLGLTMVSALDPNKTSRDGLRHIRNAAQQNDTIANIVLGLMYSYGTDEISKNELEAEKYFRIAGNNGNKYLQSALGFAYETGSLNLGFYELSGIEENDASAVWFFRLSAKQGIADAAIALGRLHKSDRSLPISDSEVVGYYQLAAEEGDAATRFRIGTLTAIGQGVPKSDADGLHYLQLSADGSDAFGQASLGIMYESGRGGVQSVSEAVRYYKLAADQGLVEAQLRLGSLFEHGRGVKQDWPSAERYYRLAADQGIMQAQLKIALMHADGHATGLTDEDAMVYSRLAANRDLWPVNQSKYEIKYANGRSMSESMSDSEMYYALAMAVGDDFSEFQLGEINSIAYNTTLNVTDRLDYYRLAGVQGNSMALVDIGDIYRFGNGVPEDDEVAARYYRMAADLGDPLGQYKLGWMLQTGSGMVQSFADAAHYYRLAANQGSVDAQNELALMYAHGSGVAQSDTEAARYYQLAAEQGDRYAQLELGNRYADGRGVPQNAEEAVRLFKLAADQGYADAQYNLGNMYFSGTGVVQNDSEAVRLFQLAADQGFSQAQYNLGNMYSTGRGVARDDAEAVRYYTLAADADYVLAQYNLGNMYFNGLGVAQSDTEAVRYYQLAANQGYADAQFNLGNMYANGRGVARDDGEAARYYRLAAEQGQEDAKAALTRLGL